MNDEKIDMKSKLLDLWMHDFYDCSLYYGTDNYLQLMNRLRNDIVDVPGVAPFKKLLEEKEKELNTQGKKVLENWKLNFPYKSDIDAEVRAQEKDIELWIAKDIYNYLLGLIIDKMF